MQLYSAGLIYSLLSLLYYKYFVDSKTFGGSEGRQDKNKHLVGQARVKGELQRKESHCHNSGVKNRKQSLGRKFRWESNTYMMVSSPTIA